MCELDLVKLSSEAESLANKTFKSVRIKSGRLIARKLINRSLYLHEEAEEKLLGDVLPQIAKARGETRENYYTVLVEEGIINKVDIGEADLANIIEAALEFLSEKEIESIIAVFESFLAAITPAWEERLNEAFNDGLKVSDKVIRRHAKPQDPAAYALAPPVVAYSITTPLIQSFLAQALERVTAKISRHFKGEAIRAIYEGMRDGIGFREIARKIHRKAGIGAGWHWQRLVRTEVQRAYSDSSRQRGSEAGIQYEYISIADTACEVCQAAHGYYNFGQGPQLPIHPNCRCTYIHFYSLAEGIEVRPAYSG